MNALKKDIDLFGRINNDSVKVWDCFVCGRLPCLWLTITSQMVTKHFTRSRRLHNLVYLDHHQE